MKRFAFRLLAVAMVGFGLSAIAQACNVPVFRFALERWRPDPYRVVLFHQGELSEAERELIRPLNEQQDKALANLTLRTVDLADEAPQSFNGKPQTPSSDGTPQAPSSDDGTPQAPSKEIAADRALYEALGKPSLPCLVVQYPAHLQLSKPAWAGPLSSELVAAAIDSPIRRELTRRLADGQTAVWLLLESGDPEQDDPAAALLQEQLKQLEQDLVLPELTSSPDDALATALPLKVEFSLMRVRRNVSAEHAMVAMLIGSEPDLAERSDPMVFPVFGRGRALLALIGPGITPTNIHEAAAFLAGPCSCQVKEQNPGFDLMLAADWDTLLSTSGIPLNATVTKSPTPSAEPELVSIPSGAAPKMEIYPAPVVVERTYLPTGLVSRGVWWIGGAVLAGLFFIAVVFAVAQTRRVRE